MSRARARALLKRRKRKPTRPAKGLKRLSPPELPRVAGRILALDVSSETVGWAVFNESRLERWGKFHPEGEKGRHGARLASYEAWLTTQLAQFKPVYLLVEQPYSARNPKAFSVLSRYYGIAELCHWRHFQEELPDDQRPTPKGVKDQLAANRAGIPYEQRKQLMVDLINDMYRLHLTYKKRSRDSDDDIADAIAVGHAWLSARARKEEE